MSFIFSTTHVTNRNVLASSSHYAIYSTPAVTMESSMISVLSNTKVYSYKYYSAIDTTSMMSTPVSTSQSTVSNTLVGAISTVFILLVAIILVILIVSVLVCRRSQFGTSYTNSDSEKVVDEHEKQQGN